MTAIDRPQPKSPSRRAVLAGAIGGLGLLAAKAVARPMRVRAADGDAFLLGELNHASSGTHLNSSTNPNCYLEFANPNGVAIYGHTDIELRPAIVGEASGANGTGVYGRTIGDFTQTGVVGDATIGTGQGYGVKGLTERGIGVYAEATTTDGYAFQAVGRAVFSRSGKVTINAGETSKTLFKFLTSASLVLATIQGNVSGTWVRGVSLDVTNGKFTIRLNKAAPSQLKVGWFIVN